MLPLFAGTIFLSAALLFVVEPMAAKLILPLLGGSPAVWNTCMVFFQAMLLAGYLGAHLLGKLRPRVQTLLYAALLCAPILLSSFTHRLIVASPRELAEPNPAAPITWALLALAFMVGAPFLLLSAAAPLLQRWFSATPHPSAKDPYFLYAASNAGSMLGLLGYPLLVEPWLTLTDQRRAWSVAFGILAVLIALCGTVACSRATNAGTSVANPVNAAPSSPPTPRTRALWLILALVPSSLTLGVTQFLSTDVAAVPLVWVVPLAIYLLTFILAFSGPRAPRAESVSKLLPFAVVAVAMTFFIRGYHLPAFAFFALHLAALLLAALLCHARLAALRPSAQYLTEFYLIVALGGVLGGCFNTLLAPLLFRSVAEYPVALIGACLLRPPPPAGHPRAPLRLAIDLALVVIIALVVTFIEPIGDALGLPNGAWKLALGLGAPAVLCYLLAPRRLSFALGASTLVAASVLLADADGRIVRRERSFFGIYRVQRNQWFTKLVHGTTDHGMQAIDDPRSPLTYYHRESPIGQVFRALGDTLLFDRVGLVGLGAGSLAAYGRPGQRMTFHEIDPAVARIAQDSSLFTYLRDCKAAYDIALGDGRLTMAAAPEHEYGLIVLDAFSSDAIPMHLMTLEALDLYLSRLRPHGLIAFHISNQFLDLAPIVARLASERGLSVLDQRHDVSEKEMRATGWYSSSWMLLARAREDFGPLLKDPRWLKPPPPGPLWTDDYSNILSVFQWN